MQLEFSSRTEVPPCLPLGPRGTCMSVEGAMFHRRSNISTVSDGSQSALELRNKRHNYVQELLLPLLKYSPTSGMHQGSLFTVKAVQQSRV